MLISIKTSIYTVPPNGSNHPEQILSNLDIRRIQQGETQNIIALIDGSIINNKEKENKVIQSEINDRIESLLIIEEDPLKLLIGCTPPHLYKLVEGEHPAQLISSFQNLVVRDQWYTPWGGPAAVRSMDKTKDARAQLIKRNSNTI